MLPKAFSAAGGKAMAFLADVGDESHRLAAGRLDLSDDGVGFRLVGARVHHHRGAGGGQMQRDGAADIAPGAGDDGDFAGEFVAVRHEPQLPP